MTDKQAALRNLATHAAEVIDGALTQLNRTVNDDDPIMPAEDYPWIVAELQRAIDMLQQTVAEGERP